MVVLNAFSKNLQIVYKSTLISKATFLVLILGIFSVVVPFIIAYKSKGFWLKRGTLHQQPDVRFKGEYIFQATTTNLTHPVACSSIPFYSKHLDFLDSCSMIQVREIDHNYDDKVDQLNMELTVNLPADIQLTSLSLVVPLDYRLHNECPMQMQSAVIYQSFLPIAVTDLTVVATVALGQIGPIQCHWKQVNTLYNNSLIPQLDNISDYKLSELVTNYAKRNVTTVLTNIFTYFTAGQDVAPFRLNLRLTYPEHRLYYKPAIWQIIKWAWIQYLAIYLVVAWAIHKIKMYFFNNRLVLCYEDNPLKIKNK